MFFFSVGLTITAAVLVAVFGLRLGVDFKGGSVIEIVFNAQKPSMIELKSVISSIPGVVDINISPVGDNGALVKLNEISEQTHQEILKILSKKFGEITEKRFDSIGPTIGKELRNKSITAILVLLLAIVVYIAIVFRKLSAVLSPWAMGFAAVAALAHDILVPTGVFVLLGYYFNVEITAVFLAAALTILGYSISDSVVVFDRIRENVLRFGAKENFGNCSQKYNANPHAVYKYNFYYPPFIDCNLLFRRRVSEVFCSGLNGWNFLRCLFFYFYCLSDFGLVGEEK